MVKVFLVLSFSCGFSESLEFVLPGSLGFFLSGSFGFLLPGSLGSLLPGLSGFIWFVWFVLVYLGHLGIVGILWSVTTNFPSLYSTVFPLAFKIVIVPSVHLESDVFNN